MITNAKTFKVYHKGKNVTKFVTGSLQWSSDVDALGSQLTFSFAQTDFGKKFLLNVGDIIQLYQERKKVFVGIIVDISLDSRTPRSITCLDFAFYLNKSETTIQFKKSPADAAIRKLVARYPQITLQIDKIPTPITKIYKTKTYAEIIKDILEEVKTQTGDSYVLEMVGSTLIIRKKTSIEVKVNTNYLIDPKRKLSIQEMKNRVTVTLTGEENSKVLAISENKNDIRKYGLLTKFHEIDQEEISKAKNIANKLLAELDKISEEIELTFLGNIEARAGRIIKVTEPITGISGTYLISNASHTISQSSYLMTLKLEKV